MTEDPIEKPPETGMERIAALESRVALLERAMAVAFGRQWLEELKTREEVKNDDQHN